MKTLYCAECEKFTQIKRVQSKYMSGGWVECTVCGSASEGYRENFDECYAQWVMENQKPMTHAELAEHHLQLSKQYTELAERESKKSEPEKSRSERPKPPTGYRIVPRDAVTVNGYYLPQLDKGFSPSGYAHVIGPDGKALMDCDGDRPYLYGSWEEAFEDCVRHSKSL